MNKPNIEEILAKSKTKSYEQAEERRRRRENKIQICVSLNACELDFIEDLADEQGLSKAAVVRQIIKQEMRARGVN